MVIVNSAGIFEDHLPKIRKAKVVIEFQEPIYMDKLDRGVRKNMGSHVSGIISERYFQLKEEFYPPAGSR